MQFIKDKKVEVWLKNKQIPFEFERVRFGDIDREEGLRRQARMINKIDENAGFIMACDMAKPDAAFPAPVLQKPPRGLMWPWSGNHRLWAWDYAFPNSPNEYIEAYTVCIKDLVMLDMLPRIMNAMESTLGFSREERVAHARWAIENHSYPVAVAAQEFGIKPEWIYVGNAVAEAAKVIADIPGADKLSKSVLIKLHPMAENTNVLRNTAALILRHNIKGDEAFHVIADVRKLKTELQQIAELGRWEKLLLARNVPKKRTKGTADFPRQVRDSFIRNLTGLKKTLDKADSLSKLQLTDTADLDMVRGSWKTIRRVIDHILSNEEVKS